MAGCGQPWVHKEVTSADPGIRGCGPGCAQTCRGDEQAGSFSIGCDFLNIHTFICTIQSIQTFAITEQDFGGFWFQLPQEPARVAVIYTLPLKPIIAILVPLHENKGSSEPEFQEHQYLPYNPHPIPIISANKRRQKTQYLKSN